MTWQPIDTFKMPTNDEVFNKGAGSYLVDNGERVGEATLKEDYMSWDDETQDEVPLRWTWTHHSTCSCCHSFMDPQPLFWQPLPEPAVMKMNLEPVPREQMLSEVRDANPDDTIPDDIDATLLFCKWLRS